MSMIKVVCLSFSYLQGSTHKRKASKNEKQKKSPTLKDLDFMDEHPDGLHLDALTYNALIKTIARDCRVSGAPGASPNHG